MSRHLTPAKIGLLTLISLYTEKVVPAKAIIPILSFLVTHVLPDVPSTDQKTPQDYKPILSVDAFQEATIDHASGIPGRTLWDLLLAKLWKVDSLDGLHVFFDHLPFLLQQPVEESSGDLARNRGRLSRNSPLGTFVRRAQIEFTRLQFQDGDLLWKAYIVFRAPTLPQWKRRNPTAGPVSFDSNLPANYLGLEHQLTNIVYAEDTANTGSSVTVSTGDIERLLEHQVEQMQRMGTRLPLEAKTKLRAMLDDNRPIPHLSHYVEFLDAWRAGDYSSSFDKLHRYFDYTMHSRDRAFYQYALLNLAVLHAAFDSHSEALIAMQETIAAARENNDMICLNYSLSWLYHFGKAHPAQMRVIQEKGMLGPEKEALTLLKAKAKESGMWSLLSTAFLSEARLTLAQGESVSQAFEDVLRASHINLTKDVPSAIGSQMMMESAIFGRLGVNCQAWITLEIFLECYAAQCPVEDFVQCVCNSANLLAQRGRYDEAFERMARVDQDKLRVLKHQQFWSAHFALLELRRHLHRDHLTAADRALSNLKSRLGLDSDLLFNIRLLEIDLKMRRRDFSSAMADLETLATKLDEDDADIFCRIKILTIKARIFDKAGIPHKGFSIALRAASLASKSKLLPSLWEAVNAICTILNHVNEYEASVKLLQSTIPQVLECGDCDLAAQTFSLLADSHVGTAGQAKAETSQRKEQLTKAVECLDRAFDEFSRIEEVRGQCEMLAKKATIMHLNKDYVLANDYAAKYLAIKAAAVEC